MITDRSRRIDSSGIRKVFDLAARIEDPVNLSIGQPDFDVPEPIKRRAMEAMAGGFNKYTPTEGIGPLRERVAKRYSFLDVATDNVLITSGVSGGLLLAFLVLIEEGDEVIIPDPYFVMYKHLCRLSGGEPVFVDTYPGFKLTPEKLESAVTERTKLLILNSPSNPTGIAYTAEEIGELAEAAGRHDLLILSDEIYEGFLYDREHVHVARHYERTLTLSGFSKTLAMTGWRVGYAVGPERIIGEMAKIQQYTFVCAPSFAQHAALAAMDYDMSEQVACYKRKRDRIYSGLKDSFNVTKPSGAFYLFPEAPGGDGNAFVDRAIARKVLVIPGDVFSERKSHFRISFAAADEKIERGIAILNELAETAGEPEKD